MIIGIKIYKRSQSHTNLNHINILSQTQNHTFNLNSQSHNHIKTLPRWTRTTSVTWLLTPQGQTPVSEDAAIKLTTGFEPDSWSQTSGRLPNPKFISITDNHTEYKSKFITALKEQFQILLIRSEREQKPHLFGDYIPAGGNASSAVSPSAYSELLAYVK